MERITSEERTERISMWGKIYPQTPKNWLEEGKGVWVYM
jgi:hypothetical protein